MRVRMGGYLRYYKYGNCMVSQGASLSLSLFTERRRDKPSGRCLLSNKSAARTRQSVQHYTLVRL